MDIAVHGSQITEDVADGSEQRTAPRFTLLIRAAKLASNTGEFVCVIRDVSENGASVRLFHPLPADEQFTLQMPAGAIYGMTRVWERGLEAGFRFDSQVSVDSLITEAGAYPKRGLRLALNFPATVSTLTQRCAATVENLSQQGAMVRCEGLFAIDQNLRVEADDVATCLKEIRAKVRWRRGTHYGLVFDDTFTLRDFALLAARLQAPELLTEEQR
jgi:hypothetical protein